MFMPPKSAPLPRKQYNKHESLQEELYRGIRGFSTLKRTKSTVKIVKNGSKYPFIKKKPLFPESSPTGR